MVGVLNGHLKGGEVCTCGLLPFVYSLWVDSNLNPGQCVNPGMRGHRTII